MPPTFKLSLPTAYPDLDDFSVEETEGACYSLLILACSKLVDRSKLTLGS